VTFSLSSTRVTNRLTKTSLWQTLVFNWPTEALSDKDTVSFCPR
jgi:hypothetical protein